MFETIQSRGVDQILALMKAFQADPRDKKVDLVVGVYKDANGAVPVMDAVKGAEALLLEQETTKTYVGMAGDAEFRSFVPPLLLGENATQIAEGRVTSLQTVGGSGALKVGCDLLNSIEPGKRLWVSTPGSVVLQTMNPALETRSHRGKNHDACRRKDQHRPSQSPLTLFPVALHRALRQPRRAPC
jgi:aspartate/tyrosine/aromatic aminotransferase